MHKIAGTKLLNILFAIYCLLLVWIILFKLSASIEEFSLLVGDRQINLIPFYYDKAVSIHFREVLENVLIFIPFGVYLKMLDLTNQTAILLGFGFCLLLEAAQFLFRIGASDITDIIANTSGTAIGVCLYALLARIVKNREKRDKVLTVLALIVTTVFVLLLILLIGLNK